jgi:hypothetical protein
MSNTIKISACDNELYLIAYEAGAGNSYELAHIKSGYNYGVDVTINVESSDYTAIQDINGLSGSINESYTVYLPVGTYTIVAACVNWGGPWAYTYNLNDGSNYNGSDSSGVGAIATGPGLTVTGDSSETTLTFSGLVPSTNAKSYNESGFNLYAALLYSGAYGVTPPGKGAYSGSSSHNLTLKRIDGGSFNLQSIDMRNFNPQVEAQNCTITGVLQAGGTVSHTFTTDSRTVDYKTYALPSSFKNLISVELGDGYVVTTNVKLT